jgi:hypothetical protein
MDAQIRDFVESALRSVVDLDVVLFFCDSPNAVDSVEGLALRMSRRGEDIAPCLEGLAGRGILDAFRSGDERYHCYGLSRRPDLWGILCRLSDAYLRDPASRKEIVRLLMQISAGDRAPAPGSSR